MSSTNIYFESQAPEIYSISTAGQFSVQYRNAIYTTQENIFENATLRIRRSNTPYQYMLIVEQASQHSKYDSEQEFVVQEAMQLGLCRSNDNSNRVSVTWYNEEHDELFDFKCSDAAEIDDIRLFMLLLYDCMYENSYQTPRSNTTEADMKQFLPARIIPKTCSNALKKQQEYQPFDHKYDDVISEFSIQRDVSPTVEFEYVPYKGSKLSKDHSITEYVSSLQAELHEYFPRNDSFSMKADICTVDLVRLKNNYTFALIISGARNVPTLSQIVEHQINPSFNKAAKSFTWNYVESGHIYSFMLKISTEEFYDDFSASFAQCLFENSTRIPFRKSRKSDQNYVINAFGNSALDCFDPFEYPCERDEQDVEEPSEDYDRLDTSPEESQFFEASGIMKTPILLSALIVSRLYVIQGNNIAVYQHEQGQMQFFSAFYGTRTLSNQDLFVSHAMLYEKEQYLLLLDTRNLHNANKIHKFDISQGKVVDEWHIEDENTLLFIAPSFKSASQSEEQTLCGITCSAVFRIDPRQAGKNKIVSSECKKHITKTNFSVAASTESGYLAVASKRGDVRLFNALNTMAKTTFPSIGEPILSLDMTESGRYIIATCSDFLLLIDVEEQYADEKPTPIILRLKSEHVMLMKKSASFSRAYFDHENRIIASTGQYLIMWKLNDVYHGRIDSYKIKNLENPALASCHISDNNIIVAFEKGIAQIHLSKFKLCCTQSLMLDAAKQQEALENL